MFEDDDKADGDAARRYRRRLKKQRIYQDRYRQRQAFERRPDREQMAAAALKAIIRWACRDERMCASWRKHLITVMASNFDPAQVAAAFDGMVERERARLRLVRQRADGGADV